MVYCSSWEDCTKIHALGEEPAWQAVGILVGTAFPAMVRRR